MTTTQGAEYLQGHGELLAPFSIYSSSVGSGYNAALSGFSNDVHLTNLHVDSYTGEEPMQGPFTEKYVGGRQYRHVNLNNSNGKDLDIRNRGTNPRPKPKTRRLLFARRGQFNFDQEPSRHISTGKETSTRKVLS
jgi:hypothetical protein